MKKTDTIAAFRSAAVSLTRAMDERLPRRPPAPPSDPPPCEDEDEAAELPPVRADARP